MHPIAIIGIGCRFPQADGPRQFWRLLRDGADAVSEVPADRWSLDDLYDPAPQTPGKVNTRYGGFLAGVDRFDPQFFGISPREAVRMDPQQRLALEAAWETLEDAGLPAPRLSGSAVGVFLGFGVPEYFIDQVRQLDRVNEYTNSGNTLSMIANRISYVFDFRGPSLVLDTACSSSLVSVLLACQSLRSGESSLALAGGVNLLLSPATTIGFSQLRALSPDGRCRSFDARANGYVRGEGVGIVLLKRLADALADGDAIYAVIRGGAMNQDGRSNGITAPNRFAQEAVLRAAYKNAGVSPGDIQYVEAHGSGTLLGDPIEAHALGTVLAEGRDGPRCAIGSVKTNIGHSEAAAGVAGLIKTALSLRHGQIPPSLHFQSPNPHIDFERLPLRVQTALEPWPQTRGPRLAGVSSFGYGGANAHVVLEGPPTPQVGMKAADTRGASVGGFAARLSRADRVEGETPASCLPSPGESLQLLTVSGRTAEALTANAHALREFLETLGDGSDATLADVCYAAAVHRAHHEHRASILAANQRTALEALNDLAAGRDNPHVFAGRRPPGGAPKVAFRYHGPNGAGREIGRELYASQPAFRAAFDECNVRSETSALPALFAVEYALTRMLQAWGVEPETTIGHWLGDGVASCVAGEMTVGEALERIASFAAVMGDLRDEAREAQDLAELPGQGYRLLVEIGPSDAASGEDAACRAGELLRLPLMAAHGEVGERLLRCVAVLYAHGVEIDWRAFHRHEPRRRLKLPTYRFQRKRYWLDDADEPHSPRHAAPAVTPTAERQWQPLGCAVPTWEMQVSAASPAWLADHRVLGAAVFPAAAVFDAALTVARPSARGTHYLLEEISLERLLPLGDAPRTLQVAMLPANEAREFQCFSRGDATEPWVRHATGRVRAATPESMAATLALLDVQELDLRLAAGPSPAEFYATLAERGLQYGPAFRGVRRLWRRDGEALGWIQPPSEIQDEVVAVRLHPALLDAALHVIAAALPEGAQHGAAFVPAHLERLEIHSGGWQGGWSHARLRPAAKTDGHTLTADVRLYHADNRLAAEVIGLRFERLARHESAIEPATPPPSLPVAQLPSTPMPQSSLRETAPLDRDGLLSLTHEQRLPRLVDYLRRHLADALEMGVGELNVDEPLHHLGLDSLVIFKVAARVERELHVEIPLMELAVGPSVVEFAGLLLQQIEE